MEAPKPTVAVGIGVQYSTHVKVYKIPLSYSFTRNLKVGVTVPYVQKSLKGRFNNEDLEDSGMGDISTNAKYLLKRETFRLVSTLFIKFPTGNRKQFEDGKERLALGSGSYDGTLSESIIIKSKKFKRIRYMGGFSYRFNGASNYDERATIDNVSDSFHFENKNGNVITGYGGLMWFTPINRFMAYGSIAGMRILSTQEKYSDIGGTVSVDQTLDDSLTTFDFIGGVTYIFSKKIKSACRVGLAIPIATTYDPGVTDGQTREVLFDFGIDYVF